MESICLALSFPWVDHCPWCSLGGDIRMNEKIHGNQMQCTEVTNDGEWCVCLCERACEGTIRLEDLQRRYPGIKISIRKEQLEEKEETKKS